MAKERIETGKAPHVFVEECDGDLTIYGRPELALQWRGNYGAEDKGDGYMLSGRGDLRLYVPAEATIHITEVSGDLIVKGVAGECSVDQVHGDAVLVNGGPVTVETIHGDLVARGTDSLSGGNVHGDLSARRVAGVALRAVYGDFSGRAIDGAVTLEEASGDVDLRLVEGDVTVGQAHRDVNVAYARGQVTLANVDGDIRLRGALPPGDHTLTAHGDIVVRWPAGAALNLVASGRRITNRLMLEDVVEKEGQFAGRIGKGATQLVLSSDGRVILKEIDPVDEKWAFDYDGEEFAFEGAVNGMEFEKIGARIEAEVNSHLARVARDFETRFGPEFGQRMAEKMARQAERAGERAERARRKGGDWRGRPATEASAPPPRRSASPEEQIKILKMVESGAITPEDAGMLLEALEG